MNIYLKGERSRDTRYLKGERPRDTQYLKGERPNLIMGWKLAAQSTRLRTEVSNCTNPVLHMRALSVQTDPDQSGHPQPSTNYTRFNTRRATSVHGLERCPCTLSTKGQRDERSGLATNSLARNDINPYTQRQYK